jgi:hypothetical protein
LDDWGVFALVDAVWRLRNRNTDPAIVAAAEAELAWLRRQPGMHELGEEEHKVADLWDIAWWAALEACCPGWSEIAGEFVLEALQPENAPPTTPEEAANSNEATLEDQMAHGSCMAGGPTSFAAGRARSSRSFISSTGNGAPAATMPPRNGDGCGPVFPGSLRTVGEWGLIALD